MLGLRGIKSPWLTKIVTALVDNVANIAFVLTDLYVIKLHSGASTNGNLANYGFCLMLANALMLVPTALFQVKLAQIKRKPSRVIRLQRINFVYLLAFAGVIVGVYFIITQWFFIRFKAVIFVFLILLVAKLFQGMSVGFGVMAIVKKMYLKSFLVTFTALAFNALLGWWIFPYYGVIGLASLSLSVFFMRLMVLMYVSKVYAS